jgi:hypothetical protein
MRTGLWLTVVWLLLLLVFVAALVFGQWWSARAARRDHSDHERLTRR